MIDSELLKYVDSDLVDRYDFYSYARAIEILYTAFPDECADIQESLRNFELTHDDILQGGGNESAIPKKFDDTLYPRGWREIRIAGDLTIKKYPRKNTQRRGQFESEPFECDTVEGFIDGHNIDFLKGRVAFDLEWNSKDQTFDRDLLAMRTYYECGLIDVGVIVTRTKELNPVFKQLGVMSKYGSSTTWIGKLIYRLDSRRNGGCPILAIGIRRENVKDDDT